MAELTGVLSLLAAYGGWLALALRQRRHSTAIYGAALDERVRARALLVGVGLLIASTACAIYAHGASFGSLFAVLALCFGALAVTMTLSFCPSWVRPIAKLLAVF